MTEKITINRAPYIENDRVGLDEDTNWKFYENPFVKWILSIFERTIEVTFIDPSRNTKSVFCVNKNSFVKQTHPDANINLTTPLLKFYLHYKERAAEKGDQDAQYDLGYLYETGERGYPKNLTRAKHYYRLAADQGHDEASTRLENLTRDTQPASARGSVRPQSKPASTIQVPDPIRQQKEEEEQHRLKLVQRQVLLKPKDPRLQEKEKEREAQREVLLKKEAQSHRHYAQKMRKLAQQHAEHRLDHEQKYLELFLKRESDFAKGLKGCTSVELFLRTTETYFGRRIITDKSDNSKATTEATQRKSPTHHFDTLLAKTEYDKERARMDKEQELLDQKYDIEIAKMDSDSEKKLQEMETVSRRRMIHAATKFLKHELKSEPRQDLPKEIDPASWESRLQKNKQNIARVQEEIATTKNFNRNMVIELENLLREARDLKKQKPAL